MLDLLPVEGATLLTFLLTAGAVVLSPGPDTILIIRYGLASGRGAGLATVGGIQLGLVGHTLLAILGISVLIASSPVMFKALAVAGAVYLGWIGLQGFRGKTMDMDVDASRVSARKAFIDGAVCNLLNPKVIILFLALLPNFVDKSKDDTLGQLLFLALILVVINVLWQVPIAWATETIRKWMARPGVQKAVNTVTGCFLVFFAALMLWEHLILS